MSFVLPVSEHPVPAPGHHLGVSPLHVGEQLVVPARGEEAGLHAGRAAGAAAGDQGLLEGGGQEAAAAPPPAVVRHHPVAHPPPARRAAQPPHAREAGLGGRGAGGGAAHHGRPGRPGQPPPAHLLVLNLECVRAVRGVEKLLSGPGDGDRGYAGLGLDVWAAAQVRELCRLVLALRAALLGRDEQGGQHQDHEVLHV